ncbi:MAG: membrane protein insertion efficiency factor YidD [Bdellovibrionota bacterium]
MTLMLSSGNLIRSKNLTTKKSKTVWTNLPRIFDKTLRYLAIFLISFYQSVFRFWFGGRCRFEPHCSEYGFSAFKTYPFLTALKLTFNRIMRCRPGQEFGYDALPKEKCCGK